MDQRVSKEANSLMWTSGAAVIVTFCTVVFFATFNHQNSPKENIMIFSIVMTGVTRLCFFIMIPILFNRIKIGENDV